MINIVRVEYLNLCLPSVGILQDTIIMKRETKNLRIILFFPQTSLKREQYLPVFSTISTTRLCLAQPRRGIVRKSTRSLEYPNISLELNVRMFPGRPTRVNCRLRLVRLGH